ncbi:MAG: hypothetical protein IJ769_01480, partial [Clostridia bacterium]|nr:hypothetical protein [Clostridia bacterium]
LDAGPCTLPQLRHAQTILRCQSAALITAEALLPLDSCGARLLSRQPRAIVAHHARQDFAAPFSGATPPILCACPTDAVYIADAAARFSADPASAPPVALYAEDARLRALAQRAFQRAGLYVRAASDPADMVLAPEELGVCLESDGESCAFADASGMLSEGERQLLTAWTALELGERALLLPVHATRAARALADQYGARLEYVTGEQALWQNALAERFPLQFALHFDGIASALATLGALTAANLSLDAWRRSMPPISRRSRSVSVPLSQTGRVLRAMAQREKDVELGGGLRFRRENGWAWICPDERRAAFQIVAEAASEEYARELCDFCESELKRIAGSK